MCTRELTVSYKPGAQAGRRKTINRDVPHLRLSGEWLKEIGFNVGQKIQVRAVAGYLILTPA